MLTITRKQDKRIVSAFTHMLADIPNGVTVSEKDFTQSFLWEGTPIGMDSHGLYHIIKTAEVAKVVGSADTTISVKKGHNFRVGDNVFSVVGGKCYAIESISTNSDDPELDDITVGTSLGVAISVGGVIYQGNETGASKGAFKYEPKALVGEHYDVDQLTNHFVNAWTIGQIREKNIKAPIGSAIKSAMKGIIFI